MKNEMKWQCFPRDVRLLRVFISSEWKWWVTKTWNELLPSTVISFERAKQEEEEKNAELYHRLADCGTIVRRSSYNLIPHFSYHFLHSEIVHAWPRWTVCRTVACDDSDGQDVPSSSSSYKRKWMQATEKANFVFILRLKDQYHLISFRMHSMHLHFWPRTHSLSIQFHLKVNQFTENET